MSLLTTLKNIFGFKSKSLKLSEGDRTLVCADCHGQFVFDAGEQRFFMAKGFSDPKRCPDCRKRVRSRMRRKHRSPPDHHRNGGGFRKHSVIDGDSPYAD